ncbi:hypothetical protein B0A52_04869 [Exophiala mesophila]|uniref:BZIP domain-containing protein n=1 Tax=Exophiala mesophila TaxID=212818 RepID=A0A438N6M9_EXOME|nr:hypothetical protein B0A52_04869 [Exophiala mesophila]
MPTTDPVRRRKQNCENQKRWRQRQTTNLNRLSAALEQKNDQIEQLQEEKLELQTQLDAALAQVQQLSQTLKYQACASVVSTQPSPARISVPPELGFPPQTPAVSSSNNRFPGSAADSPSSNTSFAENPLSRLPFVSQSVTTASDDLTTYPLAGTVPNVKYDYRPSSVQGMVQSISDLGTSIFNQPSHTDALLHASHYTIPHPDPDQGITLLEMLQECLKIINSQEEAHQHEPDVRLFHLESSCYDLLGSGLGVGRMMMKFPDSARLSRHITAVQHVLSRNLPLLKAQSYEFKDHVVSEAFSWLIRESWPSSERVFKLMTVYKHIYNFELFRNFPCKKTYYQLHPFYRPTLWQLLVPHSPAIDWLPWPEMRNKIIMLSKDQEVDVDAICMKALEHTVVEPEFSWDGLLQATSTFRMWDMYLMEKTEGGSFSNALMVHNPASPTLQHLVRLQNLRIQDISHYRIDRPFYKLFPQVATPGCESHLETFPLNVPDMEKLQHPTDITAASLQRLHDKVQQLLSTCG